MLLEGYTNKIMHIKQLTTPLTVEKAVQISPHKTTPVTLMMRYTATPYQTETDFQGKMIFGRSIW